MSHISTLDKKSNKYFLSSLLSYCPFPGSWKFPCGSKMYNLFGVDSWSFSWIRGTVLRTCLLGWGRDFACSAQVCLFPCCELVCPAPTLSQPFVSLIPILFFCFLFNISALIVISFLHTLRCVISYSSFLRLTLVH